MCPLLLFYLFFILLYICLLVYWLCNNGAGAVTNTAGNGCVAEAETSKTSHFLYVLDGTNTSNAKFYKYNLKNKDYLDHESEAKILKMEELVQKLELLQFHELPILAGISRKSMIYKTLETTPEKALNGTTFLHAFCLQKGASILRVHDVAEAVECVKLMGNMR